MLVYNHEKEMIGVDEETLNQIGYGSLGAFLEDHRDVADLFVKKPGYIHNFQNFSWIDFVRHADAEETKAIVKNGNKHFSCIVTVTPLYLTSAPEQEGYEVVFKHVRSLNGSEMVEEFPAERNAPAIEPDEDLELTLSLETSEPAILEEPDVFDIPDVSLTMPDINPDGSLDISLDIDEEPEAAPSKSSKPMLGDYINAEERAYIDNLQTDKNYVYEPEIAAEELGLPVDLIEEFIGDFIQQAHEFKGDLMEAAMKEDFDEVHVLSHKLKGVAANLRVEDAFEVLSIVNNSRDAVEIEANLKHFYRIIAKMEGKELPEHEEAMMPAEAPAEAPAVIAAEAPEKTPVPEEEDIYDFGLVLEKPAPEEPSVTAVEEVPMPEPSEPAAAAQKKEPAITVSEESDERDTARSDAIEDDTVSEPVAAGEVLQYDARKAALELDLKEAFVHDLCQEFKHEAKEKHDELTAAIETEDFMKTQGIAFEFKGLADNLRIEQISDSLKKLIRNNTVPAAKKEAERFYQLLEQI